MVADSQDALLSRLKMVSQYSRVGVHLSIESVQVSSLVALASYVHEYKYRQFQHWIPEFKRENLRLFESAAVELAGSAKSIITPPVVEDAGGKFVLIEGSTRSHLFTRSRRGTNRLCCSPWHPGS